MGERKLAATGKVIDVKNEVLRGARDEMEALQIIVSSNRILFQKVLEKIRAYKAVAGDSLFDTAKKKHEQKTSIEKKRNA